MYRLTVTAIDFVMNDNIVLQRACWNVRTENNVVEKYWDWFIVSTGLPEIPPDILTTFYTKLMALGFNEALFSKTCYDNGVVFNTACD